MRQFTLGSEKLRILETMYPVLSQPGTPYLWDHIPRTPSSKLCTLYPRNHAFPPAIWPKKWNWVHGFELGLHGTWLWEYGVHGFGGTGYIIFHYPLISGRMYYCYHLCLVFSSLHAEWSFQLVNSYWSEWKWFTLLSQGSRDHGREAEQSSHKEIGGVWAVETRSKPGKVCHNTVLE